MFIPVEITFISSNLTLPPFILRLGKFVLVSNPSSVGVNGGEVSTGGQHKVLSPLAAGAIDILSPLSKSFMVALLKVI